MRHVKIVLHIKIEEELLANCMVAVNASSKKVCEDLLSGVEWQTTRGRLDLDNSVSESNTKIQALIIQDKIKKRKKEHENIIHLSRCCLASIAFSALSLSELNLGTLESLRTMITNYY